MKQISLELFIPNTETAGQLPYYEEAIPAGFPSPGDDYFELSLDLNRELIRNPASTFYARVSGVSMINDGVDDGDLLVIDKAIEPTDGCLAVCFIDGAFTLKRVKKEQECLWLMPANPDYSPIQVTADNQFLVWGVVQYVVKKV
ncbi:MAG: LexA family protein [Marinifilaceae bacterium]